MSRNNRGRDTEYGRDDRRSRFSEEIPSRVCIANISTKSLSHREIIDWMSRYGRVLDVGFFERHILVQFDRDHEAKKAIDREKGQSYRGHRYDIRVAVAADGSMSNRVESASRGRTPPRNSRELSPYRERSPLDRGRERFSKERHMVSPDPRRIERPIGGIEEIRPPPTGFRPDIQKTNFNNPPFTDQISTDRPGFDAAIIVMSSELLRYAETIEAKLQRQIALTTHIIVLKEEAHANACVEDLTNKGVLYAFLVNTINEKHSSCTLRILYATPQEHRNMPLVSALNLVSENFESYQKRVRELKMIAPKPNYDPSRMPPGFVAPDDKTVYYLHLLADSRMLAIEELEKVIEFVQERIQALAKAEEMFDKSNMSNKPGQNNAPRDEKLIALQNQLHSQINNVLKTGQNQQPCNPQDSINSFDATSVQQAPKAQANKFLSNPNVQKALDTLMHSQFRPNAPETSIDNNSMGSANPGYASGPLPSHIPPSSMNNRPQTHTMNRPNIPPQSQMPPALSQQQGGVGAGPTNPSSVSPQAPLPYAGNNQYPPSYFQPQFGQPIYRGRPPFQRPQYPGY